MLTTIVALAAVLPHPPVPPVAFVDKVTLVVVTGADDLRGDSAARLVIEGKGWRVSGGIKKDGEAIGGGETRKVDVTPPPNTKLEDLHHMRIDFSSGRGTGFDDHWMVDGVKVVATIGAGSKTLYSRTGMGMHLKYTQHWTSPFFATAVSDEVISPSDVWAEFEHGGDDFRPQSNLYMDFELEDGRSWHGQRSGRNVLEDRYAPGARVESVVGDKFPVHSIRQIRVGFGSGALTANDMFHQLDTGDDFAMRGVRFYYKGSDGSKKELGTFPEVNHSFDNAGWWQSPMFRPFKRVTGSPLGVLIVEVLSGPDDLRRLALPREQSDHYNSKTDIWFNAPIVPIRAYPTWLMNGNYVRSWVTRTGAIIVQDSDEFPQGWTGSYASWGRFSKTYRLVGAPYFVSSDFFDVTVRFHQGKGGNLSPTQSAGGGIVGDLRQADQWDFQGLIVSYAAPGGPVRRIFSDFGIGRRMNSEGQTWRSRQFETALVRVRP